MKKKILFIYTSYSTFVKTDFEILSSKHEVVKYQFKPVKGIPKATFQFLRQLFFLVFNFSKFDAVFIWFGDYHSFLPVLFAKILGKKSFVVIGGYDVTNIPELKYGSFSSPVRKRMTLFTLKHATLCLPVVESLENELKKLCPIAKSKTIYTGYKFKSEKNQNLKHNREKIILTVSITENQQRYLIKGLDRFKELSENMPEYKFYVIGVKDKAKTFFQPIPQNLFLLSPMEQAELTNYYEMASFYAQFSRSEGLPNALCEAMLYGCIPLGTQIGGIPIAIGKFGLIIEDWNKNAIINHIHSTHNQVNRNNIHNYILSNFDIKFRESELINLF